MQLYQGREAKAHAVRVSLGKRGPQHAIEQEAGLKIGSGRRELDLAYAIAQVEAFRPLFDGAGEALQPARQVRRLADVGLGLGVRATQKENGRGRRSGGENFRVLLRGEFE